MGEQQHELMTPDEVAKLFRVDPKTVTRWAKAGKIRAALRTPGGHRRFRRTDVMDLLADTRWSDSEDAY